MHDQDSVGKIRKLSVQEIRKVWPHEEKNMSTWIADNIEVLNDSLGLQIEIETREDAVENFRLDLYGTENYSNLPLVIENQFGPSNHDHLGKLITYSADKEAGVVIWIANVIQTAHRNAVEWLNRISPQEMVFYGVELEMYQIDESLPSPLFRPVAGPPPSKRREALVGEPSLKNQKYQAFYERLRAKILEIKPGSVKAKALAQSWWLHGAGKSGFNVGMSFTIDSKFKVEYYIDTGNKEHNDIAFADLLENRAIIEERIGRPLTWEPLPNARACRIFCSENGSIDDDEQRLAELIEWAAPLFLMFKETFSPFIQNIQFE